MQEDKHSYSISIKTTRATLGLHWDVTKDYPQKPLQASHLMMAQFWNFPFNLRTETRMLRITNCILDSRFWTKMGKWLLGLANPRSIWSAAWQLCFPSSFLLMHTLAGGRWELILGTLTWEAWMELPAPGFRLAQSWLWWHLGNQNMEDLLVSVSLCLSNEMKSVSMIS